MSNIKELPSSQTYLIPLSRIKDNGTFHRRVGGVRYKKLRTDRDGTVVCQSLKSRRTYRFNKNVEVYSRGKR